MSKRATNLSLKFLFLLPLFISKSVISKNVSLDFQSHLMEFTCCDFWGEDVFKLTALQETPWKGRSIFFKRGQEQNSNPPTSAYFVESMEEKYRPPGGKKNGKDYCQRDSNKNSSRVSLRICCHQSLKLSYENMSSNCQHPDWAFTVH